MIWLDTGSTTPNYGIIVFPGNTYLFSQFVSFFGVDALRAVQLFAQTKAEEEVSHDDYQQHRSEQCNYDALCCNENGACYAHEQKDLEK